MLKYYQNQIQENMRLLFILLESTKKENKAAKKQYGKYKRNIQTS
jgi:hypothetical protein